MSNDCRDVLSPLPVLWWWFFSKIVNIVMPVYFLWNLVQESFLVGIALLIIVIPVNLRLAAAIKGVFKRVMAAGDARISVTTR